MSESTEPESKKSVSEETQQTLSNEAQATEPNDQATHAEETSEVTGAGALEKEPEKVSRNEGSTEDSTQHKGDEAPSQPMKPASKKKKKPSKKPLQKKNSAQKKGNAKNKESEKEYHLPFEAFFYHGSKFRKPKLFSKGEIVAGRVLKVEQGTISVDLFGKAIAFVDVNQPKEIIPLPPVAEKSPVVEKPLEQEGSSKTDDTTSSKEMTPQEQVESTAEQNTETQQATGAEQASTAPSEVADTADQAPSEQGQVPANPDTTNPNTVDLKEVFKNEEVTREVPVEVDTTALSEDLPPAGAVFRGRVGYISESGHLVLINGLADKRKVEAQFSAAHESKETLEGLVYGFNRGGFDVLFDGVRGFCPARGMSLKTINNPETFLGVKMPFLISPKKNKGKVIVTRRPLLEKRAQELATERFEEIKEGETIQGKVTEIKDFGFFVDLGKEVEGLVHQTEISWEFGKKVTDIVHPGKEVEVKILHIEKPSKKEKFGRVSLSLKALQPDPWEEHKELLGRGTPQKGKVIRTTDFGAFIELAKGVEGLLHISELGRNLTHANQALEEGAELAVVIEHVDKRNRKIALSKLSDFEAKLIENQKEGEKPEPPRSLKPGSHVIAIIQRTEHKGSFLQIKGILGKKGRAYIDGRDIVQKGDKESNKLSPGTELEVKIVSQQRDGTLKCSMRARQMDEERNAVKAYRKEASKQGMGTFGDLLKSKFGDLPK